MSGFADPLRRFRFNLYVVYDRVATSAWHAKSVASARQLPVRFHERSEKLQHSHHGTASQK